MAELIIHDQTPGAKIVCIFILYCIVLYSDLQSSSEGLQQHMLQHLNNSKLIPHFATVETKTNAESEFNMY